MRFMPIEDRKSNNLHKRTSLLSTDYSWSWLQSLFLYYFRFLEIDHVANNQWASNIELLQVSHVFYKPSAGTVIPHLNIWSNNSCTQGTLSCIQASTPIHLRKSLPVLRAAWHRPRESIICDGVTYFLCHLIYVHNNETLATRLNSSSFGWQSQIEHFSRLPGYSSLVFDNRGVGYSDAPRGPYS